jgi:hypothetical protein
MKLPHNTIISFVLIILTACNAEKKSAEKNYMKINEGTACLSFKKLKNQDQLINSQGNSRGVLDAYLISLATNGVKKMIDNRKKKYTAQFSMALTDLHFYNNLSTNGIFDPNGIIFQGFTLVRLVNNRDQDKMDTAFVAHFMLDTANSYEIANNSMFRLKFDSLDYRLPKARYKHDKKTMNMDFEITFNCSYVNESGNFFSNVVLGKFYFSLRNAPLDKNNSNYSSYYQGLRNTPITGACFIVPRSYGSYISEDKVLKPSYSWGNYSISATVTESSKEAFVDKMISDNSELIINASKTELNKTSKRLIKK